MRYRSRTDVIAQILEVANGGAIRTKIMYMTFTSYSQVRRYLTILLENGLIEHDNIENKYKTTAKGQKFLNLYNKMSQLQIEVELAELPRI
jgi:predicted transcriptional regulator